MGANPHLAELAELATDGWTPQRRMGRGKAGSAQNRCKQGESVAMFSVDMGTARKCLMGKCFSDISLSFDKRPDACARLRQDKFCEPEQRRFNAPRRNPAACAKIGAMESRMRALSLLGLVNFVEIACNAPRL
jgi:hypothetical protein